MEASARSFDFAQDDTAEAAIRGILPPFVCLDASYFLLFLNLSPKK